MENNEQTDLHLPSPGTEPGLGREPPPPALWRQLDAFRELLREGERLLGEVLAFTRSAEQTLVELQAGKAAADRELERLGAERDACNQEMETLRAELAVQRASSAPACPAAAPVASQGALEQRLRCAEQELERTRLVLASERLRRNRAIDLIRPASGVAVEGGSR